MDVRTLVCCVLVSFLVVLSSNVQQIKAATTSGVMESSTPDMTDTDATVPTTQGTDDSTTSAGSENQETTTTKATTTTEKEMLFDIEPVYIALIGMGAMILLMLVIIIIIMCRYVRRGPK